MAHGLGGTALPDLKDWHCVAVLALCVVLFFHKILIGQAFFWEDFLYQNYPFRHFAATSMATGQMPLWNPYTFNGMPFLADIQTAVFYLPCTVLAFFVSDGRLSAYWLELVIILHFVLAGVSMFALARSFQLHRLPSLFAGAAYMLSGFMITHAIHQQIVTLVAWYPLIVMFFRNAIVEFRWRWVFLCALALGHSTLAGFPQLSLYLYYFLFILFLFELLSRHQWSGLLTRGALMMATRAAIMFGLSIAVAMIQLLPTNELAELSQRAQITYEKATEGTLAWSQLMTLVLPKLFGEAGAGGMNYWGPGTYWYYWETCIYLGILPLLLAVVSLMLWKKNTYVKLLWGIGVFAVLFSLGNNFILHKLFFDYIPGFSRFRNPARMGIWLAFAGSLLSAFSLQEILVGGWKNISRTSMRTSLLVSVVAGIVLWFLAISGTLSETFLFMKNPQAFAFVKKEAHQSLLFLLLSGGTLYSLVVRPTWAKASGPALVAILFLDMMTFGSSQNTAKLDPADYFGRSGTLISFLKNQGASEIFRVNTRTSQGMVMDRNQGMVDRIFTMEGYTPLVLQRVYAPYGTADQTYDLLNVKYRTVADTQSGSLSLAPHPTYLPRAFFLYSIHVADNEEELLAYLKSPDFTHRTMAVIEKNPAMPIVAPDTTPRWKAHISRYENNTITLDVETSHTGILVLSEIFYPGWRAYVDNAETEILRTDYNLRSIVVRPGGHVVEFRFDPPSYRYGSMVTLASLLICGTGIIVPVLRSWRSRATQSSSTT